MLWSICEVLQKRSKAGNQHSRVQTRYFRIIHFLDAGPFALETHANEIAAAIGDFFVRNRA
jgi:hypothetical protein